MTPTGGLLTGVAVTLTLTVDAVAGDEVAVLPEQPIAPFEIVDRRAQRGAAQGGKERFVFELDLLALEPGVHEIGPFRMRVVTADGQMGAVDTERLTITVGSLLANEPNAAPKPVTQPVPVMQDDYTLAWIAGAFGALLLTALLTLLVARWWRRRPKKAAPPPPPKPPWEVALADLRRLRMERERAFLEGAAMAWTDSLSDVVRVYLGNRYDFDGLESTTDEVMTALRRVRGEPAPLREVQDLLGACDLIKFAKAQPDAAEGDRLLQTGFAVVESTTPRSGLSNRPAAPPDTEGPSSPAVKPSTAPAAAITARDAPQEGPR
jgi:hypothetical protein